MMNMVKTVLVVPDGSQSGYAKYRAVTIDGNYWKWRRAHRDEAKKLGG